jgi:hypothetical protein
MRSLMWVPIIHSPEDLGGLCGSVQSTYIDRGGQAEWDAYLATVADLWQQIRLMITGLNLDWPHVRLYQDGLPICDHEEAIVHELAQKGSDNHRLLADLIGRGAALTGTESPPLLIAEYELNRRILSEQEKNGRLKTSSPLVARQGQQLLDQRDRFIASRIAQTLQPHEQGLLFLGMLHSLDGRLPRDITLTTLNSGGRQPIRPVRPR